MRTLGLALAVSSGKAAKPLVKLYQCVI
uniref:Uncharacterized protein n=1 Tax=Anguilla anguilla TaxID=7936 RepID=A0A0E9UTL0_ANGAN